MTVFETSPQESNFIDTRKISRLDAILSLGQAAYTLFVTPEHEKLHQIIEEEGGLLEPQPLQPSIEDVIQNINKEVLVIAGRSSPPVMSAGQLIYLGSALIQFSDYNSRLKANIKIPYRHLDELYSEVTSRAQETGPLTYSDQLDVALNLTDGDVVEALWRLFITSRHYARWLDSEIMQNIPSLSTGEKLNQMLNWRKSIAACKELDGRLIQDPNGDTYYTWTHALAKYVYTLAPRRESEISRVAIKAFHNGTSIMHKVVHTFNKQTVHSNHLTAAHYGNAIGQACVDHVRQAR